ncbi:hypothetical protein ig2599ANME_1224 [groundwater metagenome]
MKMADCFQKGLLKRTSPDMENALRVSEKIRESLLISELVISESITMVGSFDSDFDKIKEIDRLR